MRRTPPRASTRDHSGADVAPLAHARPRCVRRIGRAEENGTRVFSLAMVLRVARRVGASTERRQSDRTTSRSATRSASTASAMRRRAVAAVARAAAHVIDAATPASRPRQARRGVSGVRSPFDATPRSRTPVARESAPTGFPRRLSADASSPGTRDSRISIITPALAARLDATVRREDDLLRSLVADPPRSSRDGVDEQRALARRARGRRLGTSAFASRGDCVAHVRARGRGLGRGTQGDGLRRARRAGNGRRRGGGTSGDASASARRPRG